MSETAHQWNPGPGRNQFGHFAAGNKVAVGNPQNKRMAELRKAAREAVSVDDLQAIMRKATAEAIGGDWIAARFVYEYTVGKPIQGIEVTTGDDGPVSLDLGLIVATITAALGDDQAARIKVAAAFRQLSLDRRQGQHDGPGPRDSDQA